MKIVEQVIVKPNFIVTVVTLNGSYVRLGMVSEPYKARYKINTIQFNLLKSSNDRLSLELVISEGNLRGDTITIIENLENSKANYDKLKIVLERFKLTFNKLEPVVGNPMIITAKVDNKKLDLKKKTLQIYIYNLETKLPEDVFECELKVDKQRVEELHELLQDVLKKDIVTSILGKI